LKGKVVGTYEYKDETHTFRAVFKENNLVEKFSRKEMVKKNPKLLN